MQQINIKGDALIKAIHEMKCKNNVAGFIDADDFCILYSKVKPFKGYEIPKNNETGESFPNCCNWHKSVFDAANDWFKKFPNCCEEHKKLIGKWGFNKKNYTDVANKVVTQLSFTEYHIEKIIDSPDWYEDITDFIEYNIASFGHPAVGLHLYLKNLQYFIEHTTSKIPKHERQKLIEFIEYFFKTPETSNTDSNLLYQVYNKWLKIFPFELSYFSHMKDYFLNNLPILSAKPKTNRYTGHATAKLHTKSSLFKALLHLTNYFITEINSASLYEKGILTEPQKIKLELIKSERWLKLQQGYVNKSSNEDKRFRKILKEWFADEKAFIDEITPLLKSIPSQPENKDNTQQETENDLSVPDWCIVFYYLDEAGNKQGSKISRIIKFIADNNVRNDKGNLTTKGSFKKEYYEICKRINLSGNPKGKQLPPLPPERIKKILPYLKSNKKALQTANNDIDYLSDEIAENE